VLDDGVLWLLDSDSGDLVRVEERVARVQKGVAQSAAAWLVIADGAPVVVDPSERTAVRFDPASGDQVGDTACVDNDRFDTTVRVAATPLAPRFTPFPGPTACCASPT
jgi:hypothetical protein